MTLRSLDAHFPLRRLTRNWFRVGASLVPSSGRPMGLASLTSRRASIGSHRTARELAARIAVETLSLIRHNCPRVMTIGSLENRLPIKDYE